MKSSTLTGDYIDPRKYKICSSPNRVNRQLWHLLTGLKIFSPVFYANSDIQTLHMGCKKSNVHEITIV